MGAFVMVNRIRLFSVMLVILCGTVMSQNIPAEFAGQKVPTGYENMSEQEGVDKARSMGYSQDQIDSYLKMKDQYQQKGKQTEGTKNSGYLQYSDDLENSSEDATTADTAVIDSIEFMGKKEKSTAVIKKNRDGSTEKKDGVAELLEIEKYYRSLTFFGYDIFSTTPEAFKPNTVGPVDPGYVVGPGDVMRLSVWGATQFQHQLTVTKEGTVFIPVVGQVVVTGIQFEQLQEKIKNLLSRHYSGLVGRPPTVFMDLTVDKMRPIHIYIMGEVTNPGGYTISSYATVFNALYSVGGPKKSGSFRDIKVFRNNELVSTVDLYGYLLEGKGRGDVRLQNSDVVFVPPRGKSVSVEGTVLKPAVYELKDGENMSDLLNYAGKANTTTMVDRMQVQRILPFNQRKQGLPNYTVVDLNFVESKSFELSDLDRVFLFELYNDLSNYVTLFGEVKYPGVYQVQGMKLQDLIFKYGQVVGGKTFMLRGDIVRYNEDLITTYILPFDIRKLKEDPAYNIELRPMDRIFIYNENVEKFGELEFSIEGEIRDPGTYALSTNMSLEDAILRAGGFTRKAYRKIVEIARIREIKINGDTIADIFSVPLPDTIDFTATSAGNSKGFLLKDRDKIMVRPDPMYIEQQFVTIIGKVRYEGRYALEKRNEQLSTILDRAGGLLPDAFLDGAQLRRGKRRIVVVDFKKAYFEKKRSEDIVMHPGDSIFIPKRPNTVELSGEINKTGLYSYLAGETVRDYLRRSGGISDSAERVFLIKPSGESVKLARHPVFRNPRVAEGSVITASKKPVKVKDEKDGPSVGEIVKDVFAITASAFTIIILGIQISKTN
jgi:polysaccharide export outer membrane protein